MTFFVKEDNRKKWKMEGVIDYSAFAKLRLSKAQSFVAHHITISLYHIPFS